MMRGRIKMKTARIFEDIGGYFVCCDYLDYMDASGAGLPTKAAAMRAAHSEGYTHARGSGTYRPGLTRLQS
jgi:hypothetical protein